LQSLQLLEAVVVGIPGDRSCRRRSHCCPEVSVNQWYKFVPRRSLMSTDVLFGLVKQSGTLRVHPWFQWNRNRVGKFVRNVNSNAQKTFLRSCRGRLLVLRRLVSELWRDIIWSVSRSQISGRSPELCLVACRPMPAERQVGVEHRLRVVIF
jgi:hypothetical protein